MPATEPTPQDNSQDSDQDGAEDQKARAETWFRDLRDRICAAFEALEADYAGPLAHLPPGRFERTAWQRDDPAVSDAGGGVMSLMKGRVFEKVGVNISTVYGRFSDKFADQIPGTDDTPFFWASGLSLVAHMHNPKMPALHMNTRHIRTGKTWFGGAADLNPSHPLDADTKDFHARLKSACDAFDADYYRRFKEWCDDYFYNKHRQEPRGVGGIFYDYLDTGDWEADFAFTQAVGQAFLDIAPAILRRHLDESWTDEEREAQLVYRGRYAEFNLVYDRGTRFGLETGGNVDAILMSLPPLAKWP